MFDNSKNIVRAGEGEMQPDAQPGLMGQGSHGYATQAGTGRFKEIVRPQG